MAKRAKHGSKSREVIDAIKAAAIANLNHQFSITEACKHIDVYNPHSFSSDAFEELKKEGYSLIRDGVSWKLIDTVTQPIEQPEHEVYDFASLKGDPGEPVTFVPVKKKSKHVSTAPTASTESVAPASGIVASLQFNEQQFNSFPDFLLLVQNFCKLQKENTKIVISAKIKII
jgi:plastocyanin